MADENVTASENTNETTEQATTPAVKASKPAVPSPASMKPHAPSPAAFAKKAPQHTAPAAASTGFSDADVKTAEAFGRVADDGTVFVKDGEGEREVGQFPDASKEEALALYARRYLDLKAKLDLFANKLKSNNVRTCVYTEYFIHKYILKHFRCLFILCTNYNRCRNSSSYFFCMTRP